MIRPSLKNRDILQLRNTGTTFGLNLGYSLCPEHSIDNMCDYIDKFIHLDEASKTKLFNDDRESVKRMRHWCYLTDGTQFSDASKYLLPDKLGYICKEIEIHRSKGNLRSALVEGRYDVVAISGFRYRGLGKDFIKKVTSRCWVYEDAIFEGFDTSMVYGRDRFLSLWSKDEGILVLLINKNMYSIRDMIHDSLVGGHLALGYNQFGYGLNLICVDRLVRGKGSHIFDD